MFNGKEEIKSVPTFSCETCLFKCSKKSNYAKHLTTAKHKNLTNITEKNKKMPQHICSVCDKEYKSRVGLWYHKKTCEKENTVVMNKGDNPMELTFLTNLLLEVVKNNSELMKHNQEINKQNYELQQKVLDVCSKNNNGTYISQQNNNNKTFNLQFFLNEQCKDAMNLTEFVDSMQLEFSDLEDVGKLGYVEGISKIMIRKLNELDVYKRPIHCSDAKREIMYVKEDNVWEKETNTNDHIRKAIKRVTHKNSGMLVPWSLENPNCMKYDHHLNDVYIRMMGQSMGGSGEFVDNENKIMKKIAKAVFIDKI
jgi:hypothetical protein